MGQNAKVKDRGLGSSNHGFFFAASPSSLRDTDPAQPSPPWTFPTVSPSSQFSPSPQILIFHHPYGVPTCPQATTAPGLGVGLRSSSHNTHSALHPLPSISPKINQKIILPSSRSIKGSGCPHSVLVANWNSHFSFYIFVPHSLFIFFFFIEQSLFHASLCPRRICHHRCVFQSPHSTGLPPPSPLHSRAGGGWRSLALPPATATEIRGQTALGLFQGWPWRGDKGFELSSKLLGRVGKV